jgi:hypothetical protein
MNKFKSLKIRGRLRPSLGSRFIRSDPLFISSLVAVLNATGRLRLHLGPQGKDLLVETGNWNILFPEHPLRGFFSDTKTGSESLRFDRKSPLTFQQLKIRFIRAINDGPLANKAPRACPVAAWHSGQRVRRRSRRPWVRITAWVQGLRPSHTTMLLFELNAHCYCFYLYGKGKCLVFLSKHTVVRKYSYCWFKSPRVCLSQNLRKTVMYNVGKMCVML